MNVKVKSLQGQTYSDDIELVDNFNICKDNEKLQKIIQGIVE